MQYSQEHLKTMVYAKFGGQTECIMGNWKIENGVPSEIITINTPPLPSIQSWGVCSFLQVARRAAQHFMEEMGYEKLHFLFFKLANC